MHKLILCLVMLIMVATAGAQANNALGGSVFSDGFNDYWKDNLSLNALSIDPNSFDMSHSASFSTAYSSSKFAAYESVYTNHIDYKFSPKLDLRIDTNFVNYGSGNMDGWEFTSNNDNNTKVLPNFNLEYRPFENTTINFIFQTHGGISPFRRYRSDGSDW